MIRADPARSVVLSAPPGTGAQTALAAAAASFAREDRLVVVVTHLRILAQQWIERLTGEATHAMNAFPQEPLRYLLPLLEALRLVALARWAEAAPALERAAAGARRLGGSNEQHTLLDETIAHVYAHGA